MTIDNIQLRNAFGSFATGVCVIAVPAGACSDKPLAMTINSFSSVSLDPPLLLWSIQNDSEVFQQFTECDYFSISMLSQVQKAYSSQYAKKGDHVLLEEHFRQGEQGSPVIGDALMTFECSKESVINAGDHHIILGNILALHEGGDDEPLLFYKGAYYSLIDK